MGLWQLFLMPEGAGAADGTYARYPLEDMLSALAEARYPIYAEADTMARIRQGFGYCLETPAGSSHARQINACRRAKRKRIIE